MLGFPLIFLQRLTLATSNLVNSLGSPRAIIKITPRGKSESDPGLGKLPKIMRFPFNISATAEAIDFKFDIQYEFAKAYHKITPEEK